jgi:hypothetical protein
MSSTSYPLTRLHEAIHKRARDLGYSDATVVKAKAAATDIAGGAATEGGEGFGIVPGGGQAVEIFAEALLDAAIKGL